MQNVGGRSNVSQVGNDDNPAGPLVQSGVNSSMIFRRTVFFIDVRLTKSLIGDRLCCKDKVLSECLILSLACLDKQRFGQGTSKKELMMDKVMPTAPISDVHLNQKELLKRINDAPVVLMSRSQPAAILVSVEEWNRTAQAIDIMLDLIRKDRPWFSLPLYTLADILQEVGIERDVNGALVFPTNQQDLQKEEANAALALDHQQNL
ncbi:MAG: hypothetical protein U0350_11920 [Caldilineaceae bacterium]